MEAIAFPKFDLIMRIQIHIPCNSTMKLTCCVHVDYNENTKHRNGIIYSFRYFIGKSVTKSVGTNLEFPFHQRLRPLRQNFFLRNVYENMH